jgi:hypothetical protein
MDDSTPPRANGAQCNRTRLAEGDIAAVDVCDCGLLHLHIGPFSLRLTPCSLHGLLATLASATGATVVRPTPGRLGLQASGQPRRGEA